MNYSSITDNPVTKFVLYGAAIAVFLLVTAKLVLVTAVILQLVLLIIVALYLSRRFDALWADLDEDLHATVAELRDEMGALRQEVREMREAGQATVPAMARAARPDGTVSRAQPGPTPVSAIFREWE